MGKLLLGLRQAKDQTGIAAPRKKLPTESKQKN